MNFDKIKYQISVEDEYIRIDLAGEYDLSDFIKLSSMVLNLCLEHGKKNALIDGRQLKNANVSTLDRYTLGVEFAKRLSGKVKFAGVWNEKYINNFFTLVGSNRGGYFNMFGDFDKAVQWLHDDE